MGSIVKAANPMNFMGDAIGGVTSIATTAMNNRQQERTNNANMAMNMQNLQFNKEEAEKSRQFNAQQSELQNKFNAEQAKLAFDRSSAFEREMWQKENEYNTPKAQIERLQAAGLNPNLFGGDNTASSVGAASSPAASGSPASGSPASAPSMIPMQSPPSLINPLLEASQIALNKAQAEKLGSDTDLNKANRDRIEKLLTGELEGQRLDNFAKSFDLEKMKPAELRNLEEKTNNLIEDSKRLTQETINLQSTLDKIKAEKNLTDEQVRRLEIENKHLDEYLESEINRNLSQVGLNEAESNYYAKQATNVILEGGMLSLQFDEAKNAHQGKLEITASEQKYTKFVNNLKANNPYMFMFMDYGDKVSGAVAKSLTSTLVGLGTRLAK